MHSSTFLFASAILMVQNVYGEFSAAKYVEMHNTCVAQTGCSEELIAEGRVGKFTPDPKFKQYLKCLFDQEDALNSDGTINIDRVLDSFHEDLVKKYEKAIRHCIDAVSHGGDTLDYIYNFCYCAYEITQDEFDIP